MAKVEVEEEAYKHMVTNTKVPIHGTLLVDEKDGEAIRFLWLNVNSMSFWLKENYKADQIKFIFETCSIDTSGYRRSASIGLYSSHLKH